MYTLPLYYKTILLANFLVLVSVLEALLSTPYRFNMVGIATLVVLAGVNLLFFIGSFIKVK